MSDTVFIERKNSKTIKISKNESKEDYIKKITYLYMNDNSITKIGRLNPCEKLSVLYLQNNRIRVIENLDCSKNLTRLYLQNNLIKKIENLHSLCNLKKLYLSHNCISVIEGLDNLINLEELHVEKQHLEPGDSLCFDPRSINAIKDNLAVLNISNCNLTTLKELAPLHNLTVLIAKNNSIEELDELIDVLKNWIFIGNVNFNGNPVKKKHRYRETLIVNTHTLEIIDEKQINVNTREFLKNMEREKRLFEKRKEGARQFPANDKIEELSKSVPPPITNLVSKSILCKITTDTKSSKAFSVSSAVNNNELIPDMLDETYGKYLSWQKMPKSSKKLTQKKSSTDKKKPREENSQISKSVNFLINL